MDKATFLSNEKTETLVGFIQEWSKTVKIKLYQPKSRFAPSGLDKTVQGIEQVTENYVWKSRWMKTGVPVHSQDWLTTRESMQQLATCLQDALASENECILLEMCCGVLTWGGVNKAQDFLLSQTRGGELAPYLLKVRNAFHDDSLESLSVVQRMDSGMTKIHALLSDDGLPIYDSRVAASMAELADKAFKGDVDPLFLFPVANARGEQQRAPCRISKEGAGFPSLYKKNNAYPWAAAQQKTKWLLQEVLVRTPLLFAAEKELPRRMHAFEAGLFMAGYNLKNWI